MSTMDPKGVQQICHALGKLSDIATAYDANELDDEARRFWGKNLENENQTPPKGVHIYSGRGGKSLLTLADCIQAREVLEWFVGFAT